MGKNGPARANKTGKSTPNDVVMTPIKTAKYIVDHFKPTGSILEPCKGTGVFLNEFHRYTNNTHWCEISEGKDFFDWNVKVDWIITNPPFSIYDLFLEKSFDIADNVVMFVPLSKAFKSMKIDRMIAEYGGLKEIIHMGGGGKHGFPFGFAMGCLYYKKGYNGPINYIRGYESFNI